MTDVTQWWLVPIYDYRNNGIQPGEWYKYCNENSPWIPVFRCANGRLTPGRWRWERPYTSRIPGSLLEESEPIWDANNGNYFTHKMKKKTRLSYSRSSTMIVLPFWTSVALLPDDPRQTLALAGRVAHEPDGVAGVAVAAFMNRMD